MDETSDNKNFHILFLGKRNTWKYLSIPRAKLPHLLKYSHMIISVWGRPSSRKITGYFPRTLSLSLFLLAQSDPSYFACNFSLFQMNYELLLYACFSCYFLCFPINFFSVCEAETNKWFWPANSVRSTHLLVKIHKNYALGKLNRFFLPFYEKKYAEG